MRVLFSRPLSSFTILALVTLVVAACTPKITSRGTMLEAEQIEKIEVGKSTREDVLETLGSPAQVSTFNENVWYYIGRKTEQYSFLDPEIIEQKSIEIKFDDEGLVTAMNELDTSDAQAVSPVSRRTPTYGKQTTFFEQLLGNVGRPTGANSK